VLHNNGVTSADAGATRTSRRVDKGREERDAALRNARQEVAAVVIDSQSNRRSASDVTSQQDSSRQEPKLPRRWKFSPVDEPL